MIKLEKDEKILLTIRKHWFILLTEAFFLIFLVLLPLLLYILFQFIGIKAFIHIGGNITALFIFISSIWLLFVWIAFFTIWTDYYLDILIITNKQIIDIEQKGLFSRELSTFRLDRIQDVTAEVDGIIQTFFDFGTIHVQTAGEDREFIVFGVPAPIKVKHFISKQHDRAIEKKKTVHISEESLRRLRNTQSPDIELDESDDYASFT